jgi:hypothetical protein
MADPSNEKGEKEHALHREEERQIAVKAFPSVFCVLIDLWHNLPSGSQEARKLYTETTKNVNIVEHRFEKLPTDLSADDGQRNSTGFVISSVGNKLRILTCAHGIAEIYSNGLHKVTCDMVNQFYRIQVYCIHQEESEIEAVKTPVSERKRHCTPAIAVSL